ncbi:MAG: class I SAM-dependent methyltransferase, partial [Sphingomonadales bacterium]|nr:class I SAM-dependent methyltransferase [Sphingomonadales bacterium]
MTEAGDEAPLPERLARAITLGGPIPVSQFMAAANAHYYATRDPLGAGGDFTTAPEISQMFGELIGLWAADLWDRAGRPADAVWVELGPGRG